MAFKRIFPEAHFNVYDFVAPNRDQHLERPVSCGAPARILEELFVRFLVPLQPVLGHLPGLSPVGAGHAAVAADLLLSALERGRNGCARRRTDPL